MITITISLHHILTPLEIVVIFGKKKYFVKITLQKPYKFIRELYLKCVKSHSLGNYNECSSILYGTLKL